MKAKQKQLAARDVFRVGQPVREVRLFAVVLRAIQAGLTREQIVCLARGGRTA